MSAVDVEKSSGQANRQLWFVREVLPHDGALRRFLARFLVQASDVADAHQETYARLLMLSDKQRANIRSPRAFFFRIARNIALDRLRKPDAVSLESIADPVVVDERPSAYDEIKARQELRLLTQVLRTLPERCREVLTLRKVFGLSQRDIAERLGITENTVETHIATGMRLCSARIAALTERVDAPPPLDRAQPWTLAQGAEDAD